MSEQTVVAEGEHVEYAGEEKEQVYTDTRVSEHVQYKRAYLLTIVQHV